MGLDDRLAYFILGCVIGVIIGYIIRSLREIDMKVSEVDEIVKKSHGEDGFVRLPSLVEIKVWFKQHLRKISVSGVALFVVVALSVFASFQSQLNSNAVKDTQDKLKVAQVRIDKITNCNQKFISKTILALNERTTYSTDQTKANIALQKGQLKLLVYLLTIPPPTPEQGDKAFRDYVAKLNHYVELTAATSDKQLNNPYPTPEEFKACVSKKEKS